MQAAFKTILLVALTSCLALAVAVPELQEQIIQLFGDFDAAGMPISLLRAIRHVVQPQWAAKITNGSRCPGHVFVTGDNHFGATDRLRGVVLGAYLAATTGRQLHVDPGILGRLQGDDGVGSLDWLLMEQARVAARSGCLPWTQDVQQIHLNVEVSGACGSPNTLRSALRSQASVLHLRSNCYLFFVRRLPDNTLPLPNGHAAGFASCMSKYPSAQLEFVQGVADTAPRDPWPAAVPASPAACFAQCTNESISATADNQEPDSRPTRPMGQWEYHHLHLEQIHRCAAALLHAAWAGRRLPVYAAVQSANRLQGAW